MKTSTPLTVTARLLPLLMAILASGGRADVPERLTIDADVRLRYETIDVEGSERTSRDRLRARGGFEYAASDDVDFVFRVATGRGDPVSTNLTLDSDFSVTDLQIDRAYLDWRMGGGLALRLGKMKQPWIRPGGNQLIWDNDLNPEGLALQFASGMFRGSAAELEIDGPPDGDDTRLHALQGAVTASRGEGARVTAGVSYFDYSDARGKVPFFDGKPHGNLVGPDGTFRHGFRLVELFAEMRAAVFGRPVTLFADAVSNTAASDEDRGYSVGAMLGDAAEAGDTVVLSDGTFEESVTVDKALSFEGAGVGMRATRKRGRSAARGTA